MTDDLKPPREAAEWLLDQPRVGVTNEALVHLIFEMLKGRVNDLESSLTTDEPDGDWAYGWGAAFQEVRILLSKPESPREPTLLEQYADVLCALMCHEHEGRPRCSLVPVAERLLALHEAAEHPLIKVSQHPTCQAKIEARPGDWIECQQPLGHEGAHEDFTGLLLYRWSDTEPKFTYGPDSTLCGVRRDGAICRKWKGHGGSHRDTLALGSPTWTAVGGLTFAEGTAGRLILCGARDNIHSSTCSKADGHGGQHQGFDKTQTRLVNWDV